MISDIWEHSFNEHLSQSSIDTANLYQASNNAPLWPKEYWMDLQIFEDWDGHPIIWYS